MNETTTLKNVTEWYTLRLAKYARS